ncbi:MAG TPA: MauE/DoxX family redox-associated membrane protein [Dermatophilaceae bacterium]|nr:MauE/DoxX family redox-associated membrane protein [Dermatophilaceae bacterium]
MPDSLTPTAPVPLVLAMLMLALVLGVSGLAKLRDRDGVTASAQALRLPTWLTGSWLRWALPAGELGLALALLLLGSTPLVAAAALALLLTVAYWAIIARALRFEVPVTCGCLGRLGDNTVRPRTLARNTLLVLLAALTLYAALAHLSVPTGLGAVSGPGWLWALLAALVAATAVLTFGRGGPVRPPGAHRHGAGPQPTTIATPAAAPTDGEDGALDYQRLPIPYGVLLDEHGEPVVLRTWAAAGARLLLFLSPGCAPCQLTAERAPAWRARLAPVVTVHIVRRAGSDVSRAEAGTLADRDGVVGLTLDCLRTPSAVLLGADGLLAGGPVAGLEAIAAFVDEVAEQLGR